MFKFAGKWTIIVALGLMLGMSVQATEKAKAKEAKAKDTKSEKAKTEVKPEGTDTEKAKAEEVKGSGLISKWMFDEGEGTFTKDSEGNNDIKAGKHGFVWVDGIEGKAILLSVGDGGIRVPNNESLMPDSMTFSAWVKPSEKLNADTIDDHISIFSKGGTSSGGGLGANLWITTKGYLMLYVGSDKNKGKSFRWGLIQAHIALEKDTWYHIATTYGDKKAKLYLNGEMIMKKPMKSDLAWKKSKSLYLGAYPGAEWDFPGAMDEVAVYNRVLTDEEIKKIYEEHTAGAPE